MTAELQASSPELRAFVVIGAYVQTQSGPRRPSKMLNAEQDNLRFWLRKYEVSRYALAMDEDISDEDLIHAIYIHDIQSIDQLAVCRRERFSPKFHPTGGSIEVHM